MIRRPPRSTPKPSSAASDVYKRQSHLRALGQGQHRPPQLQRCFQQRPRSHPFRPKFQVATALKQPPHPTVCLMTPKRAGQQRSQNTHSRTSRLPGPSSQVMQTPPLTRSRRAETSRRCCRKMPSSGQRGLSLFQAAAGGKRRRCASAPSGNILPHSVQQWLADMSCER